MKHFHICFCLFPRLETVVETEEFVNQKVLFLSAKPELGVPK